jgi:hypothetical protein
MPNKNIAKFPKFQLKTVGFNCYGTVIFGILQQPLILPPTSAP